MPINDEYSLTKKLCFVIERFCLSTIMFSAMAYFWLTTHGIIDIVYPKLYQGLKIAIMASPLLFYLQTVLAIVYSLYTQELPAPAAVRLAGQAAVLISAVGVVGFDIVFMVTFVKYLLKARKEQHLEDLKLQAIAKHSLGGSVCIILSVAVYVLGIGFDSGVAFAVSPCFQSFGFWILVGLKVSLNGIRNGVVSRGGAPHSSVQDVSGDSSNSGFSHDQSKTTEDRSVQKGSVTVAISVRDHMR
ncbi:hypothetical protein BDR26DRAFT_869553 [Obelidium mucronatum]|nr:hypothetical protein BDR26DRAFT_869553 [Obelidium mucronatum]